MHYPNLSAYFGMDHALPIVFCFFLLISEHDVSTLRQRVQDERSTCNTERIAHAIYINVNRQFPHVSKISVCKHNFYIIIFCLKSYFKIKKKKHVPSAVTGKGRGFVKFAHKSDKNPLKVCQDVIYSLKD